MTEEEREDRELNALICAGLYVLTAGIAFAGVLFLLNIG